MIKTILGFTVFVLSVFLVLFFSIKLFTGSNDSKGDSGSDKLLSSISTSEAEFVFREDGPIVAKESHFTIEISINKRNRTIKVIRGYNGEIVSKKVFDNDEKSFEDFLGALDRTSYLSKRSSKYKSEKGICPFGKRYVLKSNQFGESYRVWTSDCEEKGTFGGRIGDMKRLYQAQIPDYNKFVVTTRADSGLKL